MRIQLQESREEIISAGIDIGTSTTKLVLSRFVLSNTAGKTHVPRIEIIDKQVIYKSPIHRTPLLSADQIDIQAVSSLVKREYERAGIAAQDIQTGAVIITGETATKQNAEEMVHLLAEEAGEFLVATAGPDLEGIIAAKGSGAYQRSRESGKTIANIDIGGGTANIAVFRAGQLIGTCTLHIGGRLIECAQGHIHHISPPIERLIKEKGFSLARGDVLQERLLQPVLLEMTNILVRALQGKLETADFCLLLGAAPEWKDTIEEIMFSGGVSQCIYQMEHLEEQAFVYEDIGQYLALELKKNPDLQQWVWVRPQETIRATVLGAGTHTTELSGATIQVTTSALPLKNLPVYAVSFKEFEKGHLLIKQAFKQAAQIFDSANEGRNFALYLYDLPILTFHQVQLLASWLLEASRLEQNQGEPLVIVVANDMAKVLGQTLQVMNPGRAIICIDQINVEQGDYLDIGKMLQTEVVPVVVKTLAFHT